MRILIEQIELFFITKSLNISVWSIKEKKLKQELPGHADEVFALDWAPDGSRVASGGKDKILKL